MLILQMRRLRCKEFKEPARSWKRSGDWNPGLHRPFFSCLPEGVRKDFVEYKRIRLLSKMVALPFLEVFKMRLTVHMPRVCERNFPGGVGQGCGNP